ncbi:MAG: PEP-CTERM sorting domain-containing protein [Phycisphaerae bacterium]|jgi:hypothetical protein
MKVRILSLIALLLAVAPMAPASVISDASFFNGISKTVIDFETDGLGYAVDLPEYGGQDMYAADEYALQGVAFDQVLTWVNDGGSDFDFAQAVGGSPNNSIPGPAQDLFVMSFSEPVRAFGFWIVNDTSSLTAPTFTAKNAAGETIEAVSFQDALIDGTHGIAQYGFMGIYADQDIASVEISLDVAELDNLTFSSVPEPATLTVLALSGLALLRRRKP